MTYEIGETASQSAAIDEHWAPPSTPAAVLRERANKSRKLATEALRRADFKKDQWERELEEAAYLSKLADDCDAAANRLAAESSQDKSHDR